MTVMPLSVSERNYMVSTLQISLFFCKKLICKALIPVPFGVLVGCVVTHSVAGLRMKLTCFQSLLFPLFQQGVSKFIFFLN